MTVFNVNVFKGMCVYVCTCVCVIGLGGQIDRFLLYPLENKQSESPIAFSAFGSSLQQRSILNPFLSASSLSANLPCGAVRPRLIVGRLTPTVTPVS